MTIMTIMAETHLYNTFFNNGNNTIMPETHKTRLKAKVTKMTKRI